MDADDVHRPLKHNEIGTQFSAGEVAELNAATTPLLFKRSIEAAAAALAEIFIEFGYDPTSHRFYARYSRKLLREHIAVERSLDAQGLSERHHGLTKGPARQRLEDLLQGAALAAFYKGVAPDLQNPEAPGYREALTRWISALYTVLNEGYPRARAYALDSLLSNFAEAKRLGIITRCGGVSSSAA